MFMEERRKEISEIIEKTGKITICEITEKYEISDESARRDLRILEQEGLCKRTHGGAIALQQVCVRPSPDRDLEKMEVFDNYREIAKEAAKLIREGDVIYLTGGSFGYIMLSFIPENLHFTIVVNNIDIAKALRSFKNADVYVVGGKMRQSGSLVPHGTDATASFQRAVIATSRKCCLLLSSHKIGIDSFIKVCDVNIFDYIITDWNCSEEHLSAFESEGIYLTVVEEPK